MKLKEIVLYALCVIAITLSIAAMYSVKQAVKISDPLVEKDESIIAGDFFVLENHKYNSATSTAKYLTAAGASTTVQFYTGDADLLDINLLVVASSTSSKLTWKYEYSDNYIDWYQESGSQVNSTISVTYGATGMIHYWTPGTISSSLRNFSMSPTAAKYTRITFSADTANLSIWYNIINRRTQ